MTMQPTASSSNKGPLHTILCDLLGCTYPILQAGMGGVARSELVAAVSLAGAYGFLGMVRESPDTIRREIRAVREVCQGAFGVNLIPAATDSELFEAELSACLDERVHSMCFFWDVDERAVHRVKEAGALVLYQVGSLEDAVLAERAGADAVIVQGSEAGGHVRGMVSSLVLLPQVVKAVSVPVVASGGFASGEGLTAALALGCQGIHCGTAFLACRESFAHDYHKAAVVQARSEDTVHTTLFSINWPPDSPVRVIRNSTYDDCPHGFEDCCAEDRPRDVIAHEDGRPIFRYSTDSPLRTTTGRIEELALFAGQACGSIHDIPSAAERVQEFVTSAEAALAGLNSRRAR